MDPLSPNEMFAQSALSKADVQSLCAYLKAMDEEESQAQTIAQKRFKELQTKNDWLAFPLARVLVVTTVLFYLAALKFRGNLDWKGEWSRTGLLANIASLGATSLFRALRYLSKDHALCYEAKLIYQEQERRLFHKIEDIKERIEELQNTDVSSSTSAQDVKELRQLFRVLTRFEENYRIMALKKLVESLPATNSNKAAITINVHFDSSVENRPTLDTAPSNPFSTPVNIHPQRDLLAQNQQLQGAKN